MLFFIGRGSERFSERPVAMTGPDPTTTQRPHRTSHHSFSRYMNPRNVSHPMNRSNTPGEKSSNTSVHQNPHTRVCGPMDKAPVYGTGDSRFDPWQTQVGLQSTPFCLPPRRPLDPWQTQSTPFCSPTSCSCTNLARTYELRRMRRRRRWQDGLLLLSVRSSTCRCSLPTSQGRLPTRYPFLTSQFPP